MSCGRNPSNATVLSNTNAVLTNIFHTQVFQGDTAGMFELVAV